ncbi:MAG: 50S ribosomal protein L6 [Candidatus Moeniiplasma glomeromycotorum]|nr:50S ribosomal protein L6 [Candidatus Moeniiplasma glomeromycotorum]MCE8162176.1 50S ribosomal protein L6 [Candidatus Moeniiplasma glomeromycotorum]MCE8166168.1 50S ribosomal protein L6 [Candidatus Moeniiplasma glomeromycotorum]MCE8166575.1 50S ribosomal protein L6 [Candidatus Moeniiplasma glomeromycotorum]
MSRIANRIIEVPSQVEINITKKDILVKGSWGSKELSLPSEVEVTQTGNQLLTKSENTALAGTYNSLITNLIEGASKGHRQVLELERSGYEVVLEGENQLKFSLAKIKPDYVKFPLEIKVKVEGSRKITVEGVDKQMVGEIVAKIRSLTPPSVYRTYFVGEKIKKKRKTVK